MKSAGAAAAIAVLVACGGQTSGPGGPGGSGSSSGSSSSGGSSGSGASSGSGGSGSGGSSGGATSSSSGAGFGCPGNFTTTPSPVDPNQCRAQLASTTSCAGQACSWTVEIPCQSDAGAGDSGGGDGGPDCMAACVSAAPAGAGPAGFCQPFTLDGGPAVIIQCGGCGV